jgi:restriction system protein
MDSKTASPRQPMSFNDAAEYVLEKYSNGQPMHYRKITEKILELGLVHTVGITPEATLYAQILTETSRRIKRGETPCFVRYGRGLIGLQRSIGKGLSYQIESHNAEVHKKLRQQMLALTPSEFEDLIGRLLTSIGFEEVVVTERTNDGGIDVRGILVVGDVIKTKMAVQAKKWKANVQAPIVQQVRGSLSTHEHGLIITTSDFSAGAYDEAQQPEKIPVALMNGEQLVRLLIENDIGISRESHDIIDLLNDERIDLT